MSAASTVPDRQEYSKVVKLQRPYVWKPTGEPLREQSNSPVG